MSTELPIACSLSAADRTQRLAELAELGGQALLDARNDGTRAVLRFAAGAGVRERVAGIVAAESECCAFLEMGVSDAPDAVVLAINAPAGAEQALAEIVDGFRGQPRSPR